MKKISKDLREHTTKIINYQNKKKIEKEMITLTNEEEKLHREQEVSHIYEKRFRTNDDNKKYQKL